ncbi:MAG: hypothetical protein M9928_17245 [Anaerolineae bacterium]|nr:hypothetical protein [Anaerolineae bacterium]MCO5190953.1 hypothetical protein [Anaerolineae bacterium]MCO5199608.1 hypothetical protein [Anaerolineae bacterium]MCO5206761.1 hypothetical protein [Anaerolineae bacterium]
MAKVTHRERTGKRQVQDEFANKLRAKLNNMFMANQPAKQQVQDTIDNAIADRFEAMETANVWLRRASA